MSTHYILSGEPIPEVPEEDYYEAAESYQGWCTKCKAFTRGCTEPDAEDYPCPVCDEHAVVGAEHALLLALITFTEGP